MTIHAKQRAKERYGLVLSDEDLSEIGRMCLAGDHAMKRHHPGARPGTNVYSVIWRGHFLIAAVTEKGNITTFFNRHSDKRALHNATKQKSRAPNDFKGRPTQRRQRKSMRELLISEIDETD